MNSLCVCGSKKPAIQCCERFLDGAQQAKTPEQLMRSRYSAYALGGYGEYLLRTWFPATARNLTVIELSKRSCEWIKLEVLNKSQSGDEGMVEFKAHFRDKNGEPAIQHEKSIFTRNGGRWFYVGGGVESSSLCSEG
ncbi:MAG: YchJ family protein [Pseudomonadales bacterium]